MRLTNVLVEFFRLALAAGLGAAAIFAQGPGVIAVHSSQERAYAVVPMIGKGTVEDPSRPMFAPVRGGVRKGDGTEPELLSYSYQVSDDGKFALVEFVSATRAGLRPILESKAAGVVAFEYGRHPKVEIEAAFRGKKRDFDFAKFPSNKVR
jgi:hypothetical protein